MSDLATSIAALREAMVDDRLTWEQANAVGYVTPAQLSEESGDSINTECSRLLRRLGRGEVERVAVLPKGFAYRAKGGDA